MLDSNSGWILGLDIGARSIGWAVIAAQKGKPTSIINTGVRVFAAGVEGDVDSGKDSSRAAARRTARLQRRQIRRRQRRDRRVFRLLQDYGLLPQTANATPAARHESLIELDRKLSPSFISEGDRVAAHLLPYLIRAQAVEGPIAALELGRGIYHLSQRRGFKSNRRADRAEKADERSKVKGGIKTLEHEMAERIPDADNRTLGVYFAKHVNPEEQRIRQRWTSREMYEYEFDRIRAVQQPHHGLSDDQWSELRDAIFFQRPLKSQSHLVGRCSLEPHRRRAPLALPSVQRFRLLQKLNDLGIDSPSGTRDPLTKDQRAIILDMLGREGDLTFHQARKVLGLDKRAREDRKKSPDPKASLKLFTYRFSHEGDGDQKLVGDRTAARIAPLFGERWYDLDLAEQDAIVDDLLNYEHRDALIRRAVEVWNVSTDTAGQLADVGLELESGYASLSRRAIAHLLPHLETGTAYRRAIELIPEYQARFKPVDPLGSLPPVRKWRDDVSNPAVMRALSEVRKLVNALIQEYDKPMCIRVELARDLKRSRKDRKTEADRIERNRKRREDAKARILQELGERNPSRDDVLKVLLADECNWVCPYTGHGPFKMRDLIGSQACMDIEHIYPRKYLDNSYLNLTLCYHEENRKIKRDRLPYAAYAGNQERWQQILARVEAFKGDAADAKLRRFKTTEVSDDFVSRHLNDTRYNSRLAAEYLGVLYGGAIDESGKRRIQTRPGTLTDRLRKDWHVHGLKKRGRDHRHHAVDAAVVALTDQGTVTQLQKEASRQVETNSRRNAIDIPWLGFAEELAASVEQLIVSHRIDRRLSGPLHAETIYSKPQADSNGKSVRHVRKPLQSLSRAEVSKIVDDRVRSLVKAKLGSGDPAKVFANVADHPTLPAKDGRVIPIHRARIKKSESVKMVGRGPRQRYVASGKDTLHHTVIVAKQTPRGEAWRDEPVDRLEVHRRKRDKLPVVQTQWGHGERPIMILHKGDAIEMDDPGGGRSAYIILSISRRDITIRKHDDARDSKVIKDDGDRSNYRIRSGQELRKRHARKVTITPLGRVVPEGFRAHEGSNT